MNIAIVDDEPEAMKLLEQNLNEFAKKAGKMFSIFKFDNAVNFLTNFRPKYDVVFLDIDMPHLDGLEAAAKLRELDERVALIFVTNMAQYAVQGYAVDALDFIIKPVTQSAISLKMTKILKVVNQNKSIQSIMVNNENGTKRLALSDIKYIEVRIHRVIFHTIDGINDIYGTLSEIEKQISNKSFSRCNNCFLVNLMYVKGIEDNCVNVDGEKLPMSRRQKKTFIDDLSFFMGG